MKPDDQQQTDSTEANQRGGEGFDAAPRSAYFRCSCGSEVMSITYDEFGQYEVAIFRQRSRSIWSRLQTCYRVLRYGEPYGDDMILDMDTAKSLAAFLSPNTDTGTGAPADRSLNLLP